MLQQAKAVVVGGGVVGCSVLYHLTKLGWNNVALLERKVLTAGSTWHAAGGFHALNSDPNVSALQAYTIQLYRELEEISGQSCGLHITGGVNIASTPERWAFLKNEWARHHTMGCKTELVTPEEIGELCPIINTEGLLGGVWDSNEGHLDCNGVTHAYAAAARLQGAEVHQHTKVEDLRQRRDGTWDVVTDKGTVHAEHVVNAGGLWAREVALMMGANPPPLLPMSHHYILTDDVQHIDASKFNTPKEMPTVMDLDGETYMRQERGGVLLGCYEQDCEPWQAARHATPWGYGENDLLPDDMPRLLPTLSKAFERYPPLAEAGIRTVVNGPFTFTPDGNPLVGPMPGLRNAWSACGVMAGFSQGGGVGLSLAQWMVQGEASRDVFAMDVARFGPWATKAFSYKKSQENYSRRFRLPYPNEELPVARDTKTGPLHDLHLASNAVMGVNYGYEYPVWFAPEGEDPEEVVALNPRDSNATPAVATECAAVRNGVGMLDISTFAKYEVAGAGAQAFLDHLLACRLPPVGRVKLAPMLAPSGRLAGDLTIMRLPWHTQEVAHSMVTFESCAEEGDGGGEQQRYMLFGSGYLQSIHMRWFANSLRQWQAERGHRAEDRVVVRNMSDDLLGMAIAGPRSHELLQRIAVTADPETDLALTGKGGLKFMDVKPMDLGHRTGAPGLVARLSLTGELGYEMYVPSSHLRTLYQELLEAGQDLGLTPFGVRALLSMRMEKGFGIWSREFAPDYTARESGLDAFVALDKAAPFVGAAAARAEAEDPLAAPVHASGGLGAGRPRKLSLLELHTPGVDAVGYEPVWEGGSPSPGNDTPVGFITSGEYGHSVGKSLALAYIPADIADAAARGEKPQLSTHVLGELYPATVLSQAPYDPSGAKMRPK